MDAWRFAVLTGLASIAIVLGGLALLRDERQDRTDAALRLELPAFEMVYELVQSGRVTRFRLVYQCRNDWRQTLEQSTSPTADLDYSTAIHAGVVTNTTFGVDHESPSDLRAAFIPWRWFGTPERALGRARARAGSAATTELDGDLQRVTLTYDDTTEHHSFHAATGIPLDYSETYRGDTVIEQRVLSLVLLESGLVVR